MTFSEWFFQVALSGLLATGVAALMAAVLAVRGVRSTLKHDRDLAAEMRFTDDCRTTVEKIDMVRRGAMTGGEPVELAAAQWDLNLALGHLHRRAIGAGETAFAQLLRAVRDAYWPPQQGQVLVGLMQSAQELVNWRISDPQYFSDWEEPDVEGVESAIREGAFINLGSRDQGSKPKSPRRSRGNKRSRL